MESGPITAISKTIESDHKFLAMAYIIGLPIYQEADTALRDDSGATEMVQ